MASSSIRAVGLVLGVLALGSACYRGGEAGNCAVVCTTDDDCVGVTGASCVPANAGRACGTGSTCVGVGVDAAPGPDAGPPTGRWRSVDVGGGFVLAIGEDGQLYCWGDNRSGQCGQAAPLLIGVPRQVPNPPGVTAWVQASAGSAHACAVADDGSGSQGALYCWGNNGAFQTGAASSAQAGITLLAAGTNFRKAVAGDLHSCAISAADGLRCWGAATWSQIPGATGTGITSFPDAVELPEVVVDVDAGPFATCYLQRSGDMRQVVCASSSAVALRDDVPSAGPYDHVTVGSGHGCVTATDGTATCWAGSAARELGQGPGFVPGAAFRALAAGPGVTCGVSTTGTLYCAGRHDFGQLGDGGRLPSLRRTDPLAMSSLVGVRTVSVGGLDELGGRATASACAIDGADRLWCWGDNDALQLGQGALSSQPAEVPPPRPMGRWASVATGARHTCAVFLDNPSGTEGQAYCWGSNSRGQAGAGADVFAAVAPVEIGGVSAAIEVTGTGDHTCANVTSNVLCWGDNGNGQINNTPAIEELGARPLERGQTRAAAGDRMTCNDAAQCQPASITLSCMPGTAAVDSFPLMVTDGGVICDGGRNAADGGVGADWTALLSVGVLPLPPTPPMARMADPGTSHSCAITSSGDLACWGRKNVCALAGFDTAGTGCADGLTPRWVGSAGPFLTVATADDGGCAIDGNRAVVCWGENWHGELGAGPTVQALRPRRDDVLGTVAPGVEAIRIAYAEHHACAIVNDAGTSRLFCWGSNSHGQLGRPLPYPLGLPVQVLDPQ